MVKKALEGVKVADFTWALVGPISTKTLSDHGAEVIKIEGRIKPDPKRYTGPFRDETKTGLNLSAGNPVLTGKLSLSLNLAHPEGVKIAKKVVAWADVVAENFRGGAMERIGLGYEELKKIKPDIIMMSSCMMGQTGPYSQHPGVGAILTGMSGIIQVTGWPDRGPSPLGPYTDFIAPHFNALAILAALDYRRRTGRGVYLDMSQYQGSVHFMGPLNLDWTANKRIASREGNRCSYAAPHGVYRCRGDDRWCAIAVFTDEEWASLCKVIGSSWTDDRKFATLLARKENEDELDRLLEEWTINYSPEELMARLQGVGVGAGIVETSEDVMEHDPQLRHRQSFWELDHPEVGQYRAPTPSFKLSKSPHEMRRAPLLGEHNEYVLKNILGMPDDEIAELVIKGVIE